MLCFANISPPLLLLNRKRFYHVPVPASIRSSEQVQIFLWWIRYKWSLFSCFFTDTVRRLTRKDRSDGAITPGGFFDSGSINILCHDSMFILPTEVVPSLWIEWGLQLIWLKSFASWKLDQYRGSWVLKTKTFVIWWHEDDVRIQPSSPEPRNRA